MLRQSRYASGNCPIADHDLASAYGFTSLIFKGIFANPADSRNGRVSRRKPVAHPVSRAFKTQRVANRGHPGGLRTTRRTARCALPVTKSSNRDVWGQGTTIRE